MVYSRTVPRAWRGWMLCYEILVFMFCMALETNFAYSDPGCADEPTALTCVEDTQQIRIDWTIITAIWNRQAREHVMRPVCEWETCSKSCQLIGTSGDALRRNIFSLSFW